MHFATRNTQSCDVFCGGVTLAADATCPAGMSVVSGGYTCGAGVPMKNYSPSPNTWHAECRTGGNSGGTINVYAYCCPS